MRYERFDEMLQAVLDELRPGDTVMASDDPEARMIGFHIVRHDGESPTYEIALSHVRARKGVQSWSTSWSRGTGEGISRNA